MSLQVNVSCFLDHRGRQIRNDDVSERVEVKASKYLDSLQVRRACGLLMRLEPQGGELTQRWSRPPPASTQRRLAVGLYGDEICTASCGLPCRPLEALAVYLVTKVPDLANAE
jgi:hypothetical protein